MQMMASNAHRNNKHVVGYLEDALLVKASEVLGIAAGHFLLLGVNINALCLQIIALNAR